MKKQDLILIIEEGLKGKIDNEVYTFGADLLEFVKKSDLTEEEYTHLFDFLNNQDKNTSENIKNVILILLKESLRDEKLTKEELNFGKEFLETIRKSEYSKEKYIKLLLYIMKK